MTREEIIRMAREAGFGIGPATKSIYANTPCDDQLERFAALVAAAERKRLEATAWGASKKWIVEAVAAEREACAKVCLEEAPSLDGQLCAAAIRARSKE